MLNFRQAKKKIWVLLALFSLLTQNLLPFYSLLPNAVYAEDAVVVEEQAPEETIQAEQIPEEQIQEEPISENNIVVSDEVNEEISVPEETPTPTETEEVLGEQVSNDVEEQVEENQENNNSPPEEENTEEEILDVVILNNVSAPSLDLGAFESEASATLATDKADYAPTDTAIISGSGFNAGATYALVINSEDEPPTKTEAQVTADESGTFTYAYQLDGIYRPNYKVEAKDSSGNIVAIITFTDSPTKITAKTHQGQKSDLTYTSGNITEYEEGEFINFRFETEATHGPTSGQIEVRFSGDDGTCLFFDNYFNLGTIESLSGGPVPTVTVLTGPTAADFGTSSGEWVVTLNINYTGTFDHPAGLARINYTLQLSNEAGQCNGSSQHSRLNPAGGTVEQSGQQNVPIPANQVIELPDITVTKMIDRDGNGTFEDTAGVGEYSFTLDGTTPLLTDSSGQVVFINVTPNGTHTITETQLDFSQGTYQFISGSGTNCTFNGSTATATVSSGTTPTNATCNFNNAQQTGSVNVHKLVDTDGNGTYDVDTDAGANALGFNWNLDTVGTNNFGTAVSNVSTGSHSISENSVTGYHFVGWYLTSDTSKTCANTTNTTLPASISVTSGQTINVTLCNAIDTGTVTVYKDVQGPNGEDVTDASNNFKVSLDGGTGQDISDDLTVIYNNVPVGSHTITESLVDTDYTLYGISSVAGGAGNTSGLTITVTTGTNDVYVTNRQKSGTITVIKDVINPDGGAVSDTHTFTVNLTPGGQSDTFAEGDNAVFTVNPGTYTASESADADYTDLGCLTATGKADIVVDSGKSVTITCTNQQKKATIDVIKDVLSPTSGAISDNHAFTAQLNGGLDQSFSEATTASYLVNPGNYSITELSDNNYDYVSCTPDSNQTAGDGAQITVGSNGSVTVTCTNKQKNAQVTVVKDVRDPSGADVSDSTNFVVQRDGAGTDDKTFREGLNAVYTLVPGTYTLAELVTAGYTLNSVNPDDDVDINNGTTVTLHSGENQTITFTNYQNSGSISGQKLSDTDGVLGTTADQTNLTSWVIDLYTCSSDFLTCIFSATDTTDGSGYSFLNLIPGYYQVREVLQGGWTALTSLFQNVTVDPGENETGKNFVNFDNVSVTACKKVDADGNIATTGDQTPAYWEMALLVDGQASGGAQFTDRTTGCYTWVDLGPGHTYGVSEATPSGWTTLTDTTHSFGAAAGGSDYTYTFVNFENATIIVHKNVVKPDGTTEVVDPTSFTSLLNTGDPKLIAEGTNATYSNLTFGTHTVTEDTPPAGYALVSITDDDGTTPDGQVAVTSGDTYNVYVTNRQLTANLTLVKHLPNDNGGTALEGEFNVYIDGIETTWGSHDVDSGSYIVSEDTVDGYTASNWSNDCDANGNVTLLPGESKTCEITNDDQTGRLVVRKIVINDNGGDKDYEDFSYKVNDGSSVFFESDGQNESSVDSGSYTIVEDPEIGYTITYDNCDSVFVPNGGSATCTITNDDIAPTLTFTKLVTNNYGGTLGGTDFPLFINGESVTSGAQNTLLANFLYTLTETQQDGYTGGYFTGDCNAAGSISLLPGENKTCYISNADVQPLLTVTKVVINDNGGTKEVTDFPLFVGTTSVKSGAQHGYNAGTYTVSETSDPGYTSSITGDCSSDGSVTLSVGDVKSCTITNDDIQPKLTVIKVLENKDLVDTQISDFPLSVDDTSVISGDQNNFNVGGYIVSELNNTNYSYTSEITGDCDPNGNVTLSPGDEKSCTITNTLETGTITVDKVTDPSESIEQFTINLNQGSLDTPTLINSSVLADQDTPDTFSVPTGAYWFEELVKTGWDLTDAECTDGEGTFDPRADSFSVEADVDLTCTFTNTQRGSISGYKFDDADGDDLTEDDQIPLEDWVIELWLWETEQFVDTFQTDTTDSNGLYSFENLLPGLYQIREILQEGWTKISPVGGGIDVTLDPGESDEDNNFVNFENVSISGHKWNDLDGDGEWDEGEPALEDWTINLNGDEQTTTTNGDGYYEFLDLGPGTYTLSETEQEGWTQTYPEDPDTHTIDVSSGQNVADNDFGNFRLGQIYGFKYSDTNGNGVWDDGENGINDWEICLDNEDWEGEECVDTYDSEDYGDGYFEFTDLEYGDYVLTEDQTDSDYQQTQPESGSYNILIESGSGLGEGDARYFGNAPLNEIFGFKWNDENGNGERDEEEELLGSWTIFLDENGNEQLDEGEESTTTEDNTSSDNFGRYRFNSIFPDEYSICEVQQSGWIQTYPLGEFYDEEEEDFVTTNCHHITLPNDNEQAEYNFGNQEVDPILEISKVNNTGGADKSTGSEVVYTITLEITESDAEDVTVTDLLPEGFTYKGGSWQVLVNGFVVVVPEPVYASPGTWLLGNLNKDDIVELIYTAVISSSQEQGLYKDLAWAKAEGSTILALAQPTGFVAENFVGTQVNVVKSESSSVNIEKKVEGEVLGAATEALPATGGNTLHLVIAVLMLVFGLNLVYAGYIIRKRYV